MVAVGVVLGIDEKCHVLMRGWLFSFVQQSLFSHSFAVVCFHWPLLVFSDAALPEYVVSC